MLSFLIAVALKPDTLFFLLYYDIQRCNHTEIPVSKLINDDYQ